MIQLVKNPSAMQETWVQFLGQEDLLEKGMATHSSILAWRTPMDRGAPRATAHGSQRVRYDPTMNTHTLSLKCSYAKNQNICTSCLS